MCRLGGWVAHAFADFLFLHTALQKPDLSKEFWKKTSKLRRVEKWSQRASEVKEPVKSRVSEVKELVKSKISEVKELVKSKS